MRRIDRYLVKCLTCELEKIPRGLFSDHLLKVCKKKNISCSASDIQCPWAGPSDQLDQHFKSCSYEQIRPALEKLQNTNHYLQQKIQQINERCDAQQIQINELKNMMTSNKTSDNQILTFDDLIEEETDLNSYDRMPSNYGGFTWQNGAFMPRRCGQRSFAQTGFGTAFRHDVECVAFNFGSRAITMHHRHKRFHLLSFNATCAFQDQVNLTVIGRCAGEIKHTAKFILRWQEVNIFQLNWKDIDEVEFQPSGGKQIPTSTDADRHVILTSLRFA